MQHFSYVYVALARIYATERDTMRHTDHDWGMTLSLHGAQQRFLTKTARHVLLNAERGVEIDDEWVDQQLELVGASRDEYEAVYAVFENNINAHLADERADDLSTTELEDEVVSAIRRERAAAARTNELLSSLNGRDDAAWDALAALVGIPVDALRTRAGRDPDSAYAATGYATLSETAQMLGIDRSTLHRRIRAGKATPVDVRGRAMFPLDEKGVPIL